MAHPTTDSPRTNDPFLQEALSLLSKSEQSVVQEHATFDISTTIQAAYNAARDKKDACERERWPGDDKADKVILWLDRFKSVGDVVANVDPIHVGLPWAGIRVLLEAAVTDSHQMSALVSGMDLALRTANRLRAYFVYYQRLPPNKLTTDNLGKALVSLYARVLRFLVRAIQVYSMKTAARKAQAFWQVSDLTRFESESDQLGERADIEANNCDRELRARQSATAAQWKKELAATLQQLNNIQSIELSLNALQVKVDLSKLLRIHEATYNSTVESKLSRCLNGTRSQILQRITNWAVEQEGKPIFWLCGQAGTGKSTISRTVAYTLDKQECLGASFFFKRGEWNRSNANYFFPTVTAQLADLIPQLQAPIAAALEKDPYLCRKGIQTQFEKLLLEPLISISPTHLLRKKVTVVIDALDECDEYTDIRLFLRLLTQVKARSALQLRVFLTSRPELPIRLAFRQLDGTLYQDVVLEGIQEATIHDDIRTYLNHEFANIRRNQSLIRPAHPLPTSWPSEEKMRTLVSLAVPLFTFATTVCRFVSESDPEENLEVILQQQYSAESTQMARLYLPILNELLIGEDEDEQDEILTKFREVIGAIVLAADPLSVTSLASILGLTLADVDRSLERLHSVLQVPENPHDSVRLLHFSFRDFLTDAKRKDQSRFWVSGVETHRRLARGCLRLLDSSATLKSDICRVVEPGTRRTECSARHVTTHIPPDVAYACSYWPLHFVGSGERLLDKDPVHCFLQQHLLHWLEALSWLGKVSSAVAYISDLLSVVQDNSSVEVSRFLQDAKRFVLQNRYAIDLAPLQVYHSAMMFTPMQSIVRQAFHEQVPQLWARLPEVPLDWSAETQKLEGHDHSVTAVAFSPNGQVIASASGDRTVRLWDAATDEQRQKLEGHDNIVNAVAFSPDHTPISNEDSQRVFTTSESVLGPGALSFHDSGLGSSLGSNTKQKQVGQDAADTESIQSTQSTVRLDKDVRNSLVDDFVGRLASETKRYLTSDAELGKMSNLLRDFAIIVKKSAQSEPQREAAKFVRGQRSVISVHFRELVRALSPLQPSREVTSEERMEMLFYSTTTGKSNNLESALEAGPSDSPKLDLENGSEDEDLDAIESSEPLSGEHDAQRQQIEDARQFLMNSTEFQWLCQRVRILSSRTCIGTAYDTVRSTIARQIDSLAPDSALTLSLQWNPLHFLQDQYAQQDRWLPKTIVFCGSVEASYACTAEEYLQYLWPNIGLQTVLSFQRACDSVDLRDEAPMAGATLSITLQLNCTYVSLSGNAQSMLEIAEASVWLATACRAYDTSDCAAYCEPMLGVVLTNTKNENILDLSPAFDPLSNDQIHAQGSCWLNMVHNPVIVQGYPTPSRDEDNQKGLEAPIEMLIALSSASWATTFRNRFLLKGSLSALVPVWESDSAIVWHLLVSENPDCRLTYNSACEIPSSPVISHLEMTSLSHRRHFVGIWTRSAKVLAGSADKHLYELYQSQSQPINHSTITWAALTLNGGKVINLGGNFVIGRKDTALRTSKADDFEFRLGIVEQEKVIFYGNRDRRAWLLDGASALLHLTTAWLAEKGFHELLTFFQFGREESGRPNAKDTLLRNRVLKIFAKPEGSRLEIVQSQEFSQDFNNPFPDSAYFSESNTSSSQEKQDQKSTISEWTFEALAVHFLHILEDMFDKLAKKDSAGPQLAIKPPSTVPVLHGWEFKDIMLHRTSKGMQ